MKPYKPFTYVIGWSDQDKYYYGVRYKQGTSPADLWTKYFTSSKYVEEMREKYGEPDVIQVRRTFTTAQEAIDWEGRVLTRLNIKENTSWLNKNIQGAILLDEAVKANMNKDKIGVARSKEVKEAISRANKGSKRTSEQLAKMRKPRKNIKKTPPFTITSSDGRSWSFKFRQEAYDVGFSRTQLCELFKGNTYTFGMRGKLFKKGTTLYLSLNT